MDITWLGHSCFFIKGSKSSVLTDPYSPDLGYSLGKPAAKVVTVSHQHPGHSFTQGVSENPRIIKGPGEYEVAGVLVIGIATSHDAAKGAERGKNTVYLIEVDDVVICHLGDIGHSFTSAQVEEIGNVDVLLTPVGGVSTINASVAAEVVRQLEPKIVIPMHYKTEAVTKELEPVDGFLKEMGVKEVNRQPKLSITKANLPLTTQVYVLDYQV